MKVISSVAWRDWKPVSAYHAGTPLRFKHAFHQSFRPDDIFIVNAVCSSYRPENRQYDGKVAVTHLKTGKLSYVAADRDCCHVDAVVRLDEEDCSC